MAKESEHVSGVAGRYASALFSLAQDERQTAEVASAVGRIDAMIAESADLQRLVRSPVFSSAEQTKALNVLLARAEISGIAANKQAADADMGGVANGVENAVGFHGVSLSVVGCHRIVAH